VTVVNSGSIGTEGDEAAGIFAQSVGGGGGNASQVVSKFAGAGAQIAFGIGGSGGEGGTGGDVTVENLTGEDGEPGLIVTSGDRAHGIIAMSIGGGGGNGSTVLSGPAEDDGLSLDLPESVTVAVNIGGEGGTGGTSGLVTVLNDGEIVTYGEGAHGIFAQSVGGGGGNGGAVFAEAGGVPFAGELPQRSMSIGGSGGSGNVSGDVVVTNSGAIEVFGDGAYGVFAQSVGGGGGNGGMAGRKPEGADDDDGSFVDDVPPGPSLMSFALGGEGGEGADSGDVTVDHTGSIVAHGDNAYGIYAQSVAGGGGTMGATYDSPAGSATDFILPMILGSRDGGTGEAGTVTVNTEGSIVMLGANSRSHFVQSVNGGGGNLDVALDATGNLDLALDATAIPQGRVGSTPGDGGLDANGVVSLAIDIGSAFVEEGAGAAIEAAHEGDLFTMGDNSAAATSQSVGGGGGSGVIRIARDESTRVSLDVDFGGEESEASGGGDIALDREGDTATAGENATGTLIQSIGGGGGNLIVSVTTESGATDGEGEGGSGAETDGKADGETVVAAAGSDDLAGTEKVAADGSTSPFPAGTDRRLDETRLSAFAPIAETDRYSAASALAASLPSQKAAGRPPVTYQPVKNPAAAAAATEPTAAAAEVAPASNRASIALGAKGSAGNDGGNIQMAIAGDTATEGSLSPGLVVQSIGAGGGDARIRGVDEVDVTFGGTAGASGDGGDLVLDHTGDIFTAGALSHGVVLQSIGGGGGLVLTDTGGEGLTWNLRTKNAGSGGDITFRQAGDIVTAGDGAIAVLAQSLGGGGGALDRAYLGSAGGEGSGGNVTIDLEGSAIAEGFQGIGVFAQSSGADGRGDIEVRTAGAISNLAWAPATSSTAAPTGWPCGSRAAPTTDSKTTARS